MDGIVCIPVSTGLFLRLCRFLDERGSGRDPGDVVESAIEYWLANADWKSEDLMPETIQPIRHLGYHWKPLLLPPGTSIRMKYKGQTYSAEIVGNDFIYASQKMTPSEFANSVAGGTNRNAWRDLWIQRPQDMEFRLADDLRRPPMTVDDL